MYEKQKKKSLPNKKLVWFIGDQKNLDSHWSRQARLDLLDWNHPDISIVAQADLVSLNRSSLCYKPIPLSPEETCRKHRIDEPYTAHPFMGYRTIAAMMNRERDGIHKNTVRRYMQEMGLIKIMTDGSQQFLGLQFK